jgi:hypothetical protein
VERFQALDDLIREVEAKAADEPETLALTVALIKLATRSEVDPYLQGIASTVSTRIPRRRRQQVAVECVRLLLDRLQADGTI